MRFVVFAALLAVACAAPQRRLAPVNPATNPVIKDQYIVVFSTDATDEQVERHHNMLSTAMAQYNDSQRVMRRFRIRNFRGYAAQLTEKMLETVREEPMVKYIDYNQEVKTLQSCGFSQSNAVWGLTRTSSRDQVSGDGTYYYSSADGRGVDAYVIDTGIDITHPDFKGNAKFGADFTGEGDGDENGHGTHVAGTIMSETYGIAKGSTSIAVKVLGRFGSGSWEGVLAGVEWVAQQHTPSKKSVANMSLGGGYTQAINDAVEAAIDEGVNFALAAGNEYTDACSRSPAATEKAVTVVASDISDSKASFSNQGKCTNIIAPGVNVVSTYLNGGTSSLSGTSMASPHVAGVMALLLSGSNPPATPALMKERLTELGSKDKISGIDSETPNVLLFNGCSS